MSIKLENKTFFGCTIPEKAMDEARERKHLSLSDMFDVLLHNQTIINEKLSKLLKI